MIFLSVVLIEFFIVCTKLAEMALLYSKELTTAKKKLPPVGLELMQEIITGLGVQYLTMLLIPLNTIMPFLPTLYKL